MSFQTRMGRLDTDDYPSPRYDVTGDGERFLINVAEHEHPPINVVVNGHAELETR